jgi:hypothetical protein
MCKKVVLRLGRAFVKGAFKTLLAFAGVLALTSGSWAFTVPSGSGFFYDIYDILVNKMINGPVGTATGVGLMVYGGIRLALGQFTGAVLPILGGATLVKAESLAQSIGMTINNF